MKSFVGFVLSLAIFPSLAFAARPLSTDDAATVEKAHFEVENGYEYKDDSDDEYNWTAVIKYGLDENWDLGVEIPYQYIDIADGDDVDGLSDIVLCSKYLLTEESEGFPALAFSFSIKTHTGEEDEGLGTGELDYAINTILTKELNKIIGHLNLGYTYAGVSGASHDNVLSYALAFEYPVNEKLNFVGEVTGETNFEGDFDDNPFAGLVGLSYALSEILTFDLGIGWKISKASPDYIATSGLTLAF